MKDTSVIPQGHYCYNQRGTCPYFDFIRDEGIRLPFCTFLEKGGISNHTTDEQFQVLEQKYGGEERVWEKYPLDLLWDQCKECGENIEDNDNNDNR